MEIHQDSAARESLYARQRLLSENSPFHAKILALLYLRDEALLSPNPSLSKEDIRLLVKQYRDEEACKTRNAILQVIEQYAQRYTDILEQEAFNIPKEQSSLQRSSTPLQQTILHPSELECVANEVKNASPWKNVLTEICSGASVVVLDDELSIFDEDKVVETIEFLEQFVDSTNRTHVAVAAPARMQPLLDAVSRGEETSLKKRELQEYWRHLIGVRDRDVDNAEAFCRALFATCKRLADSGAKLVACGSEVYVSLESELGVDAILDGVRRTLAAQPGARILLANSLLQATCDSALHLANRHADANGNWQLSLPLIMRNDLEISQKQVKTCICTSSTKWRIGKFEATNNLWRIAHAVDDKRVAIPLGDAPTLEKTRSNWMSDVRFGDYDVTLFLGEKGSDENDAEEPTPQPAIRTPVPSAS